MSNRTVASAMWFTLGLAALTRDAAAVPDANWPQWRGPQGLAVSSDAGLPTEWSPEYVPSPILYGRYLYLMTDTGLLTCLDAVTGERLYEGGRVPVPATFTHALS